MKKATIFDYARMCKFHKECDDCALAKTTAMCQVFIEEHPDEANEIILKWCEEHPVEVRQSKLLKMFPNARMDDGILAFNPCAFDDSVDCNGRNCFNCRKGYWLAEVDENE